MSVLVYIWLPLHTTPPQPPTTHNTPCASMLHATLTASISSVGINLTTWGCTRTGQRPTPGSCPPHDDPPDAKHQRPGTTTYSTTLLIAVNPEIWR
jgi:hypothetical protein